MFNSYGRRANDNLLMDYGFAMLDNEWDEVRVSYIVMGGSPYDIVVLMIYYGWDRRTLDE